MEEKRESRKVRQKFTPDQKFEILKDIERGPTIKEELEKHRLSDLLYRKWKRQLEVGVKASLRNGRPLKPADLRRLEVENRKLKGVVLNQALMFSELKKRDGLGLREGGRLMGHQKQAVMELVEARRGQGRSVAKILGSVGVALSS